jgi:tetratricopeptide (TPR) repeat protein
MPAGVWRRPLAHRAGPLLWASNALSRRHSPAVDGAWHGGQGITHPTAPGDLHAPGGDRPRLGGRHPLLALLLGVPVTAEELPALAPEAQRRRLQHACCQVLLQWAADAPLCLLVEDGHWLDPSSQELLDLLVAALARQLDPEDLRAVVRAYQDTCARVIARYEGHIAQYLGDGLLVYFGYPLAHEDDAQRAVRAGLGMIEALGQLHTRLEAHYALGNTLNCLGEFAAAQAHLAQGIALYDPQQHRSHAVRYGQDPGMFCRAYAALTLWCLGYPDQALQRSHEAVTLARELAHPFSLGIALCFAAILHQFRREGQLAQEWAEAGLALATEQRFAVLRANGTIFRGWALAQQSSEPDAGQGQREAGMAQIQQGLAAWRATGSETFRPYGLALLAEASAQAGQIEEGLTLLTEALAVAKNTGERRWDAELYRLQGEVLLARTMGQDTEVETCFHQALDIARRQEAKSLELRAAMSLCRL